MKRNMIATAVISVLACLSTQAMATGLVSIPATGFPVTGGTSAYRLCNTSGNFGSSSTQEPTASVYNDCAVFPTSTSTSPVSGYLLVASNTANLNFTHATYTAGATVKVGTLRTSLWRNTTTNQCITGARVTTLTSNDIDVTTPGVQTFVINDVAIGGFAAYNSTTAVNAGYHTPIATTKSVVYRIGRTFTAVQHRANPADFTTPAAGYVARPLTTSAPVASTAINGLSTYPSGTPTAAQQAAALSANWVTFTSDASAELVNGFYTEDGTALYYVEASCPSATYTITRGNDILRFRQTGQRTGVLLEITAPGFVMGTDASATTF